MRKTAAPSFPPPQHNVPVCNQEHSSTFGDVTGRRFFALSSGHQSTEFSLIRQVASHSQRLSHQLRLNFSMSKKSEKPAEGKEPESSWKDVIYNPRTGQFFGRTARNWGELTRTLPTASLMLLMKCAVYINNCLTEINCWASSLKHEDPLGSRMNTENDESGRYRHLNVIKLFTDDISGILMPSHLCVLSYLE